MTAPKQNDGFWRHYLLTVVVILALTLIFMSACKGPTEPDHCDISSKVQWDSTGTKATIQVTVYPDWYVKICNQVNGRKP